MKLNKDFEILFEKVYIETPVDTDNDGKYDLIAAYIKRPVDTINGKKVPCIFVANPYMLECNEDWYSPHNVDIDLKVYDTQKIDFEDIRYDFSKEPAYTPTIIRETKGFAETSLCDEDIFFESISDLYSYQNERGYATIFSGGLGTKGSDGLCLTGSREEILAFKAVIDWLNGRARAFTNKTDNIEVKATWCTGNVAMSAKSYLGTMCIGVAATGVEGLKTIIPEAGIVNWYDYYRCNGLTLPALGWQGDDLDLLASYCFSRAKDPDDYNSVKDLFSSAMADLTALQDRDSANYNKFWDERNYLNQIDKIKASVFIIHGINDWNVKTNQCFSLFEALQDRNIERKLLLHQGEHIYVYDLEQADVLNMVDRWLDHYLKGEDNGIDNEEKIIIESNIDQLKWYKGNVWPPVEMQLEEFGNINLEKDEFSFVDDLSSTVFDPKKDNLKDWLDELVLSQNPEYSNRLKFEWDPFNSEKLIKIAGEVQVEFEAKIDRPTGILSCMLVDYGKAKRITNEEVLVGGFNDGTFRFKIEDEESDYKVISRGWMNVQNRSSIWSKDKIQEGKAYKYSFNMIPTHHELEQGHTLGLIIYGIDAEATQRPKTKTTITVLPKTLKVMLPIVREH